MLINIRVLGVLPPSYRYRYPKLTLELAAALMRHMTTVAATAVIHSSFYIVHYFIA